MIEQFLKNIQANASASPFALAAQEATQKVQVQIAKFTSEATAYAQIEVANAITLSQAKKPEEALAALVKGAQDRQAYFTEKTKDAVKQFMASGSEFSKALETKGAEAVEKTHGAIDAAFATAKQGLNIAESTAKSVVNKSAVGKKKA